MQPVKKFREVPLSAAYAEKRKREEEATKVKPQVKRELLPEQRLEKMAQALSPGVNRVTQYLDAKEVYRLIVSSRHFHAREDLIEKGRIDIFLRMARLAIYVLVDKHLLLSKPKEEREKLEARCLVKMQKCSDVIREFVPQGPLKRAFFERAVAICSNLEVLDIRKMIEFDSTSSEYDSNREPLRFPPLTKLRTLITPYHITDKDMECFMRCSQLTSLQFMGPAITDVTLILLVQHAIAARLTSFDLTDAVYVSEKGIIDFLNKCGSLTCLSLNTYYANVTDETLFALAKSKPPLEKLSLKAKLVSDVGIEALMRAGVHPAQLTLGFNNPLSLVVHLKITDRALKSIALNKNLRALDVSCCDISNAGLHDIMNLPLESLVCRYTGVDDRTFTRVSIAQATLKSLDVTKSDITKASFKALADRGAPLTTIYLDDYAKVDFYDQLERFPHLRTIFFDDFLPPPETPSFVDLQKKHPRLVTMMKYKKRY